MIWLCAIPSAFGGDLDSRVRLSDALLAESRGDITGALAQYTELSRTLPNDDPTLPEALYWLGHGLYELGRVVEARASLLEGIRTGHCVRCRDLLEVLEIEAAAVTKIPVLWTFDGPHGLIHPWRVQDQEGGTSVVTRPGKDPELEWRTSPQSDESDRLVVGLRNPSPPPEMLRVSVLSMSSEAMFDVVAEDDRGYHFALPGPIVVPQGEIRKITVPFASLLPTDGTEPLETTHLVWVSLVDRTGMRGVGKNTLWIDDFELR